MASDVESNFSGAHENKTVSPRHGLRPRQPSSPITESEVLIESEFLELNNQSQYSKTVHMLLTDEFVFVKEMRDRRESEAFVLQYESAKKMSKYRRCDVNIQLSEGCPFTLKAKWSKEAANWKTYELCGKEEVWPKWLRGFNLEETQCRQILPSSAICEIGADTDSDDNSEDEDGEDILLPNCTLTLSVDRAISMWSMSMLNPSNVRKLHNLPPVGSVSPNSSTTEVDDLLSSLEPGSLYRSNSHPRVAVAIPFRCPSLPSVSELKNVRVDSDLKNLSRARTRGESTNSTTVDSTLLKRDSASALFCNHKNLVYASLQERVENLRSHPANLNFVRKCKGGDLHWNALPPSKYSRKHSLALAMNVEGNRIHIPSDSSPNLNKYINRTIENKHLEKEKMAQKMDSTSGPRKIDLVTNDKHLYKRADSLPCPKKADLSRAAPSPSGEDCKGKVVKQLEFKDDMAVELNSSDQKPRKDKVRRFLTILYKKKPKLRTPALESEESVKELDNINSKDLALLNVVEPDPARPSNSGVPFRRGGFSGSFSATKDKMPARLSREEPSPLLPPVCNKQDPSRDLTLGRTSLSTSGSMRKKKLVKKILSPIFKSNSCEEDNNCAVSPTGEVPTSPVSIDTQLPNLPQRLVDIDTTLFAREVTLIDKELFIRIPWPELSNCGWMTKDKYLTSPNVMAMVEFFNRVALLAASEILSEDTPTGRARVISKIIQIADKCHLLGNFNSLKALLAGLQSTPIYRLKETWKEVSSKRKKKFRDLSILMGESENFSMYRTELSAFLDNGACLPFLGNFLTEIAQTHTYLACRKKRQPKAGKPSSSVKQNVQHDTTDGSVINNITPNLNGVTVRSVKVDSRESGHTSPLDRDNVTLESSEKRNTKVKRSCSRSKLRRFYNRSSISDSGVILNRSRNSSTELMDGPEDNLQRNVVTSSSDSVITSTGSLNDSPRNANSGNSRTPSRPPLLRRLSETSSNHSRTSLASRRPKRRLSESKTSETRRSLKALIRRTPSSQSVKEGRVSRGPSSEKLTVSLSTLSVAENSNALESFVEKLAKSQSSPSVEEGGRVSPELERVTLSSSPEVKLKRSSGQCLVKEESPTDSNYDLQSGTERQLWLYQIASIQYDFVSRPFVRHFLLSASFNSEEENYRQSLKCETPKKSNS